MEDDQRDSGGALVEDSSVACFERGRVGVLRQCHGDSWRAGIATVVVGSGAEVRDQKHGRTPTKRKRSRRNEAWRQKKAHRVGILVGAGDDQLGKTEHQERVPRESNLADNST